MDRFAGDLAAQDVTGVVRALFLERATGVLEVTVDSGKRRLFFVDGELHLPPSNPLALQITRRLQEGANAAEIEELMGRVAAVILGWREGAFTFDPGRAAVPPDAVGPLPTAALVMSAAVLDRGEADLIERLGGERARWGVRSASGDETASLSSTWAARVPAYRSARLSPGELALREMLGEPRTVGELLGGAIDRPKLLASLSRLAAVGAIERSELRVRGETPLDSDVLSRFAERVGKELMERPVALDAAAHRARVGELLGRLGEVSHYELLGVMADAGTDQVHAAYDELSRLVHPSHATRLGFKGREEGLRLLFEKATEAYLVLSDPERRNRYNLESGIFWTRAGVDAADLPKRSPEVAIKLFTQARDMVQREEYHYAYELLRQALQVDRRPEYYALLAEVQKKNPNWLHHAVDSLREALNLAPDDLAYRRSLGELYEEMGDLGRARAVYRSILIRAPGDREAVQAIERLEGKPRKRKAGFFGLFGGE